MPVKTGREQAAPAGALNAGRCNALFVFIVQEDIAGSFQSEAVGMPRKGADMAQNNTKMRTWFAGKDEPALNLPGGDRIRSIEIEFQDTVIQMKAYRKGFQEVVILDGDFLTQASAWRGKSADRKVQDACDAISQAYMKFRKGTSYSTRVAQQVHTPQKASPTGQVVDPVVTILPHAFLYPHPIGQHGLYEWKHRRWTGTEKSTNPNIRRLGRIQARVFPRYARKAWGPFSAGDFIGLGGPDAKLFRNDPEAVRFIRENTIVSLA